MVSHGCDHRSLRSGLVADAGLLAVKVAVVFVIVAVVLPTIICIAAFDSFDIWRNRTRK